MKVTLENLTKSFGSFTAVNQFNATLEDGELVSLLGPSGCGKSTILNMLAGILPVTSGKIYFDNDDVTNMAPEKRGIGLVFQNYALYPHMTVLQNICFPLEIQRVPKAERIARAKEIAKLVHVDDHLEKKPGEMSGGQQQRVAIARALVKRPRLLLLDEPLSNLDARLRLEMREEIRRIQLETGVTSIFVTHDQEEAMSISDHIVLMKNGVLQQYDVPQALYNNPANQFVADFLGNPPINNVPGVVKDGQFMLEDGSAACPLPELSQTIPNGRKVNLSIRAESVQTPDEAPMSPVRMKCTVKSMYAMGKEELGYLQFGSQEFRAYISSDSGLRSGSEGVFSLKNRGVYVFDAETGVRYR
ncbi:MAG: ABC transporter ATP-binding protein [Clostridia bacterium]|nr:ABC transporter ATP-binding protein [Clostridia bacterium]